MKEVLTKKFWQDVKKTFDEAREGPPACGGVLDQAASTDVKPTKADAQPKARVLEHPDSSPEESSKE